MTVYDYNRIDEVGHTANGEKAYLAIDLPGGFEPSERFQEAAAKKLGNYVGSVQSGAFHRQFPQYEGLPVVLMFRFRGEMPYWADEWLSSLAQRLAESEIEIQALSLDRL